MATSARLPSTRSRQMDSGFTTPRATSGSGARTGSTAPTRASVPARTPAVPRPARPRSSVAAPISATTPTATATGAAPAAPTRPTAPPATWAFAAPPECNHLLRMMSAPQLRPSLVQPAVCAQTRGTEPDDHANLPTGPEHPDRDRSEPARPGWLGDP